MPMYGTSVVETLSGQGEWQARRADWLSGALLLIALQLRAFIASDWPSVAAGGGAQGAMATMMRLGTMTGAAAGCTPHISPSHHVASITLNAQP